MLTMPSDFPDVRFLGHVVVLCSETGGSAEHGDRVTAVVVGVVIQVWRQLFRRSGQANFRFIFRDQLRPDGPDDILYQALP